MNKILVPTDFSDLAFHAAEIAAQIARKQNAWLFFLHVIPMDDRSKSIEELEEEAQLAMEAWLQHEVFDGLNCTPVLHTKKLEGALIAEAHERQADLIVMGSHGKKATSRAGSNTSRVVRLASCPVLVIKNKGDYFDIRNVVFASHFYGEVGTVFAKIKDFAEVFDATIHLLKVITPKNFETTDFSMRLMEDFAREHRLKNYTVNTYNHETKEAGIHAFAKRVHADLISLTTHGRKGLSQLLLGSLTESVADHSNIPVISVKIPELKKEDRILFPD